MRWLAGGGAPFEIFGGWCSIAAGLLGIVYTIGYVVVRNDALNASCVLLIGLASTVSLVALYDRLREIDRSFALWALVLGVAGTLGAAIHGGYDLALALHPPVSPNLELPNPIDPRGLLSFGFSGLALFFFAGLIGRDPQLPKGLGALGYLTATLLVFLYLARLIVLSPRSTVLILPALLSGLIVSPAWHLWLGRTLLRGRTSG